MSDSLKGRGVIALLGLFSGLCAIFALVVSIADGWHEHLQATWPQVTATIERCSVDRYIPLRSRSAVWSIRCRIGYRAAAHEVETTIGSRSTTSGWGGDAEGMRQWVAGHPSGSSISVHYDPVNPVTAILTATDMPYAGPRTPSNLKLLLICSVVAVSLFTIANRLQSHCDRE